VTAGRSPAIGRVCSIVLRRSISTLLAGLLAWFSVGAVERSATAALDDASWSADAGHAALVQGSRPAQDLARPRANRGLDAVLGRCLVFAPPTLRPPSSHILLRAAAPVVGIDRSCRSRRSSRGPPA
jgi:hypothetical protein